MSAPGGGRGFGRAAGQGGRGGGRGSAPGGRGAGRGAGRSGGARGGRAGLNGGRTGSNGGRTGSNGGRTGFNGGRTGFNGGRTGYATPRPGSNPRAAQFVRSVLRGAPNHDLEKRIASGERAWLQSWEAVGSLPPDAVRALLEALARLPFSAKTAPPSLNACEKGVATLLSKGGGSGGDDGAMDGNDDDLEKVELVERLVKRLMKFVWSMQAEDVKEKLGNMLGAAISKLKYTLGEHRRVITRLTALLDEIEKPWMIRVVTVTANSTETSEELSVLDWRTPTVGWLSNYNHFQPLLLPKMQEPRARDGRVFASTEEYFDTILKLWTAMTFIEGNNALLPHCSAKFQEKVCDQPLWPIPQQHHSLPCRNPQCHRQATFVCANRNHNAGYCSKCAGQRQQKLCGPPSDRASTHIYDATITHVKHDGTISVAQVQSRRPPLKPIHWRTTKRLASPNLVGVVLVAGREASLRESDTVYWGQIVFQGQSFDEYKAREHGRMTFRLLEYRGEAGNAMMAKNPRPGDSLAIIDCQTFVPEFIPVLKALEMQSRVPVPFKNGALLNLCEEARNTALDDIVFGEADSDEDHDEDALDIADMASYSHSSEELVQRMVYSSALEPIIDIRRDTGLCDRMQRSLVSLVKSATLDGGQLTSFVEALIHPVHCTQGPPGTGKSYLGVVIVRALLIVRELWKAKRRDIGDPPILVLSYKNHAIDEFLIDLLRSEPTLNHNQMRMGGFKYRGYGFQKLIRIGGSCNEPELAQYAERNTAHHDPAVRAVSKQIDDNQTLLDKWQQLQDDLLPVHEAYSEVINLPIGGPITTDFQKSVMKAVPVASHAIATLLEIQALARGALMAEEGNNSEEKSRDSDDEEEPDSSQHLSREDRVKNLSGTVTKRLHLQNSDFEALFNGIRHYDPTMVSSEVLYQWLIGFHPLPACASSECMQVCKEGSTYCPEHACAFSVDGSICDSEVVPKQAFCPLHLCSSEQCKGAKMEASQFCQEHSCQFFSNEEMCCNEVVRKRLYCSAHLCTVEKCKEARVGIQQQFCDEHACVVCLLTSQVARQAEDSPPRNVCELHPLCHGMNGDQMCLEQALPESSYCLEHQEELYCKWRSDAGEKCQSIATQGQYCQSHEKIVAKKLSQIAKVGSVDTQCTAFTKRGKQCRSKKLPGMEVCRDHTGKSWAKTLPEPTQIQERSAPSALTTLSIPDFENIGVSQAEVSDRDHEKAINDTNDFTLVPAPDCEKESSTDGTKDLAGDDAEEDEQEGSSDEVASWDSGSDSEFVDVDATYDNIDEVEESDHLHHLREVYEVEETNVAASESEEEEEEEKAFVSEIVENSTRELILPGAWTWDMELLERWSAVLAIIELWGDLDVFVQSLIAENVKALKHELRQETLRASARVYEGKSVIGGTITGCVARLEAIRMTNPFAILVEEASEVMEPLLFSCFSSSTVKLEMIGDHLQLQPAVMNRIDFERVNKINISMFERLVCAPPGSAAPWSVLSIQRRMRKNICDLTRGFYSDITTIEDHDICRTKVIGGANKKVKHSSLLPLCEGKGREVPGVLPHIFFWTHRGAEQRASVGLSRENPIEAHMTCSLAKFLVHCGVHPKSIAILTPYKGQLMLIRKLLMGPYKMTERVKDQVGGQRVVPACIVSTVDRFQGDEADIVLISLVIDGKSRTPFVKLQNRMIVLLSRARLGMYIIGNMDYFGETRHWQLTLEALKHGAESDSDDSKAQCSVYSGKRIGSSLPICCPLHRESATSAAKDKDLKLGFCSVVCSETLKCSHPCSTKCHYPDLATHNGNCVVKVESPCERHPKELTCKQVTTATNVFPIEQALEKYQCTVMMEVTRPCGHSIKLNCYAVRDIEQKRSSWPSCSLPSLTPFIYPDCKHLLECSCAEFERYSNGNAPLCTEKGEYTPVCKHSVTLPCHVRQEHDAGTRKFVCKKKVTVDLPRCGHNVTVPCSIAMQLEEWEGQACLSRGVVVEGEPYGPKDHSCRQMVKFLRACGHAERVTCERAFELAINPSRCLEAITVINPECGHECGVKCFERGVVNVSSSSSVGSIVSAVLGFGEKPKVAPVRIVKEGNSSNHYDYGLKLQCSTIVTLERACGHQEKMKCSEARRLTSVCTDVVEARLPLCGHKVTLPCNLQPLLEQWEPWGDIEQTNAKEKAVIERLIMSNVASDSLPLPTPPPSFLRQHIKTCRAPVRFARSSTCGHEIELKCDTVFRILAGTEKPTNCNVRVTKTLDCGHEVVTDCFKQSEQSKCEEVIDCPCWNFDVCGNMVQVKCSASSNGRVMCDLKSKWTCKNGHSYSILQCSKGAPSHCPGCCNDNLERDILQLTDWQQTPPESLSWKKADDALFGSIEGATSITLTSDSMKQYLGRQLKDLARFQDSLPTSKPWTQTVYSPKSVLCFLEPHKLKLTNLEQFDPCKFTASRTLNGIEVYEATQDNFNRVCGPTKTTTLLIARVFTLKTLFDPNDIPQKKGKKSMDYHATLQSWVAAKTRLGFDSVYQSTPKGSGGKLTVWPPLAIYPTHTVELTRGNRDAVMAVLPTTSQLEAPAQISFSGISGLGAAASKVKAIVTSAATRVSEADRESLQRLVSVISPLYEKLDVQFPWDGKTLILGDNVPSKTEKLLATKLNFVPAELVQGKASVKDRKPFAGLNCLKNVTKTVPLKDANLFSAMELLAVRKQDTSESRALLEQYVKSRCDSGEPAHPLTLLAILRLHDHASGGTSSSDIGRQLLVLFGRLYPAARTLWLDASEQKVTEQAEKSSFDGSSVGIGFSNIEEKWQDMKDEHGCHSDAMDELLKLVGLRKVKEAAIQLFKNAIALQKMSDSKRKKNVMTFNFCFLGNPGTGKTTVARLFARILKDSTIRPKQSCVECTAQKLKDDGADEFRKKVKEAIGGVLFIDEAYELDPVGDFKGKPIVAELLTAAEDKRGDLSIILAGYEDDIQKKLYAYNDGLSSRFIDVTFEDFDAKELEAVWKTEATKREWEFEAQSATVACRRLAKASGRKGFGNARAVRKLFERAIKAAMARDDFDGETRLTTVDLIGERPSHNPKLRQVLDEMETRIGWGKIKAEVKKLIKISDENYERELKGVDTVPLSLNRLFLGNPGTGKTTFASYYGRVLKALEFLSNGEVVKKTAGDFVGSHVGESQTKTNQILTQASGKVLVIDEAYNLNDNMYGKQVLDVLVEKVQGTDSDDIAVILIGYEHEMTEMLRVQNPGLRRRFPPEYAFHFEDYTEHELLEILELNCRQRHVSCPLEVAEAMLGILAKQKSQANFGNAGAVEQLLKHAMATAAGRPMVNGMTLLALEDVDEGSGAESSDPLDALNGLYRVDNIREQLIRLRNEMTVAQREGTSMSEVGHFVFRGSPGTGKTTVARVMAKVLYEMGALATNKLVETSGLSLTGEYVGQTKKKVTDQLSQARGGVLFIDEAYELGKGHFGEEAMTTLVAAMTDPTYHGLVIVIAGYPKDIDVMLDRNAGLKSRFTRFIDFLDWEPEDAVEFVNDKAEDNSFEISPEAVASLYKTFTELKQLDGFGNGRDAVRVWKELVQSRAQRVVSIDETTPTITEEDAEKAGLVVLEGRRPPDARLLSQSSTELRDPLRPPLDVGPLPFAQPVMRERTEPRVELILNDEEKHVERQQHHEVEHELDAEQDVEHDTSERDDGVSDADWAELQRAKYEHEARVAELKREEELARRKAEELKRQEELARLEAEERKRIEEERRKVEEQLRRIEEERRKAEAIRERLRQLSPCPAGFNWYQVGGGWRCGGGSHFVSDAQLQRQFTH